MGAVLCAEALLTASRRGRSARRSGSDVAGKRRQGKGGPKQDLDYVEVLEDGSDAWRAARVADVLRQGGVGVIPTDTSYSFVCRVDSKAAVQRLLALKGEQDRKKPLALLCGDLATIDAYTRYTSKVTFKLLRRALPGPYTFILPASDALPRVIYKDGTRRWKRDTVGVRIPDDPVCRLLLDELDGPLFCSSVPTSDDGDQLVCRLPLEDDDGKAQSWCALVDFVVDAGTRPVEGSTIYDLAAGDGPVVTREGLGPLLL